MADEVEILRVAIATCNLPGATVLADCCYPEWTFSGGGAGLDRLFATLLQLGHTIDAENADIRFVSFQPSSSDGGTTTESEFNLVLRLNSYQNESGHDDFTTGIFFRVPGAELAGSDPRIAGVVDRIARVQAAFERELLPAVREQLLNRGPGASPSKADDDVELPPELSDQCQAFAQRIPEFIAPHP
jgi:hypothetical protein